MIEILVNFLSWNINISMRLKNYLVTTFPDKQKQNKAKKLMLDLIDRTN